MAIDPKELSSLLDDAQRLVDLIQVILKQDADGKIRVSPEETKRVKKLVFQISAKAAAAALD
jgi:hypothetical protein